jgi:hypothetical protein
MLLGTLRRQMAQHAGMLTGMHLRQDNIWEGVDVVALLRCHVVCRQALCRSSESLLAGHWALGARHEAASFGGKYSSGKRLAPCECDGDGRRRRCMHQLYQG